MHASACCQTSTRGRRGMRGVLRDLQGSFIGPGLRSRVLPVPSRVAAVKIVAGIAVGLPSAVCRLCLRDLARAPRKPNWARSCAVRPTRRWPRTSGSFSFWPSRA
jgi:hypothetical protein